MIKKRIKKNFHYKSLVAIIGLIIIVLIILSVFITTRLSKHPQKTSTQAKEEDLIQHIQAELEEKPLSTICSELDAQVISPFSNCPQGKLRLSDNQDNPLYYCCR